MKESRKPTKEAVETEIGESQINYMYSLESTPGQSERGTEMGGTFAIPMASECKEPR